MDYQKIIDKYYTDANKELRHIYMVHCRCVADKALECVDRHPELKMDRQFVEEAGMLHDLGIFKTDAPKIHCYGAAPYICHGVIGADILREEGFPKHALVCERHTGAGISLKMIIEQNLPLPHRDMLPVSLEEQVVCFADKFYSKSNINEERTVERALKSFSKYGPEGVERFRKWCKMFL